jgi:hypothetical protein
VNTEIHRPVNAEIHRQLNVHQNLTKANSWKSARSKGGYRKTRRLRK